MFDQDFEKLARTNTNFRKVLHTGEYCQIVAMSIPVGDDIGEEVHPATDQIFLVVEGSCEAEVGNEIRAFEVGEIIFVPAGTHHNVRNMNEEDLKLLTIYAPPAHPDGEIQATKTE